MAPYQFTPLLNLRPTIFRLTPFWRVYFLLCKAFLFPFLMGILFLIYAPLFEETKLWPNTRSLLYLDLSRTEVTEGRRKLYNEALVTCTALPLLQKPTAAQIMKEFLRTLYNQKFITVPTTGRHPSLYSARRIECLEFSPSVFTPSRRQVPGHAATPMLATTSSLRRAWIPQSV